MRKWAWGRWGVMTGFVVGAGAAAYGDFAAIPDARLASGTSWQPDATPTYAEETMAGPWMLMVHYNAFLSWDDQTGPRGGHQLDSANWVMGMVSRRLDADDDVLLRGMFTLEPWTVTERGYPLLLQTGEAYNGEPLVDRQHPHDALMELAARYRHAFDPLTAVSLYVAPSGEPALGPTAFMHRMSAADDPAAPISHHWMDSTHIAFGVATLGVSRGQFQCEGSAFNGREPDQYRWDIDPIRIDSYSGRVSWNPGKDWSLQTSYGYLKSPEQLHPLESEHRVTASATRTSGLAAGRYVSTTVAWGRNISGGRPSDALLAETDWQFAPKLSAFGRAEYVQKTGEELALPNATHRYDVAQLTVGGTRQLFTSADVDLDAGAELTWSFLPRSLRALYGSRPVGYWLFLRLRPARLLHPMKM